MTRVILPLCTPGFLSAGIFAFTLAQNEFLYALLFLNTSTIRTVPVGVTGELIRGDAFYWGQLMAAALLGSLPVVLIYSFFVKYYVAGLTAGSVKGGAPCAARVRPRRQPLRHPRPDASMTPGGPEMVFATIARRPPKPARLAGPPAPWAARRAPGAGP